MQPTPSQMHVDHYLTNLSVVYAQQQSNFVAGRVFRTIPVSKQSNKFPIYDKGYFWRNEMGPRPLGGRSRDAGPTCARSVLSRMQWTTAPGRTRTSRWTTTALPSAS